MDELNALPYLDAVVRETLRIHAPIVSTMRVATRDDILPLSEPIKNKYGRMMDGIPWVAFLCRIWWLICTLVELRKEKPFWSPFLLWTEQNRYGGKMLWNSSAFVQFFSCNVLFTYRALIKTRKMGNDAKSCYLHSWHIGKYLDIPCWASYLHWSSFRCCRVCVPLSFRILWHISWFLFFQDEGFAFHPHQGIWIWIGCTTWRYR